MVKKFFLLLTILFFNILLINSYGYYHPHYPFYPPFQPYYPIHPYGPNFIFLFSHEVVVHKMGNVYLDKDLTGDANDIESLEFTFGVGADFKRAVDKKIYFTESGAEYIGKYISDFLQDTGIPDNYPKFDNLKSYSIEEGNLKLKFLNNNNCYKEGSYDPEEQYLYDLNYSFIVPYTDALKTQFDEMSSLRFKNEVDSYIQSHIKMKAAGISVFVSGMGLMGLLNIASLIVLYNTIVYNDVPMAVPGALFLSGLGAVVISLSVGVPLWAASGVKKKFTINFGN
jgi:hypothetical protein